MPTKAKSPTPMKTKKPLTDDPLMATAANALLETSLLDLVADKLVDRLMSQPDLQEQILRKIAGRFCAQESNALSGVRRKLRDNQDEVISEAREAMEEHTRALIKESADETEARFRLAMEGHLNGVNTRLEKALKQNMSRILSAAATGVLARAIKNNDGSLKVSVELSPSDLGVPAGRYDDW